MQVEYNDAKAKATVRFQNFPWFIQNVADLVPKVEGSEDLMTSTCATFNATNVQNMVRSGAVFGVVAADADLNGNGEIDLFPDEYHEMRDDNSQLATEFANNPGRATTGVDRVYQMLRQTASVRVGFEFDTIWVDGQLKRTYVCNIMATTGGPYLNDCLVTMPSALGQGQFAQALSPRTITLTGTNGRNHSSVADVGVAWMLVPWLTETERSKGDLK